MKDKEVTDLVEFLGNDDECLPITKCICGARFDPWTFIISIYRNGNPHSFSDECIHCKRKFYFRTSIRIFEIKD